MTIQRLSESYAEKLYGDKWKHDNNALAARYAYACGAEEILSILEDCFPTKLSNVEEYTLIRRKIEELKKEK